MRSSFLRIKKIQNFFRELVFQHYISKCRSFHILHKFALIKYACHLVFSELLAGWNSVLSKYAGHLVFQKCSSAGILSTKYAGHLVFLELLTGRNSLTKMCQSFSFSVFTDGLLVMQTLTAFRNTKNFNFTQYGCKFRKNLLTKHFTYTKIGKFIKNLLPEKRKESM